MARIIFRLGICQRRVHLTRKQNVYGSILFVPKAKLMFRRPDGLLPLTHIPNRPAGLVPRARKRRPGRFARHRWIITHEKIKLISARRQLADGCCCSMRSHESRMENCAKTRLPCCGTNPTITKLISTTNLRRSRRGSTRVKPASPDIESRELKSRLDAATNFYSDVREPTRISN